MKWALVLHIYQPPTQRRDILDLVARESYRPLLDLLLTAGRPVTLNISGTLIEQLANNGYGELIEKIKELHSARHITLTTTAYTHALLPLWPDDEVRHQIKTNNAVQRQYLGSHWRSNGLYLPECAYSPSLDAVIDELSLDWVIIDELSLLKEGYEPVVSTSEAKHRFIVRHRALSQALATDPDQFVDLLHNLNESGVAVLDGEVFGHFDPGALSKLTRAFELAGDELGPAPSLLHRAVPTRLRAASWETLASDLKRGVPFPVWQDKRNPMHRLLWHFYRSVYRALKRGGGLDRNEWTRRHFDNGVASCYLWWANLKRTAGPFKMEIWNPDMIVAGISEIIKAVRTDHLLTTKTKRRLETEHADVLKTIWRTHWKYKG